MSSLDKQSSADRVSNSAKVASLPDPKSERRLVERLTGWRVIAFFVSAAVNLGALLTLIQWPWMFDESQAFIATALVTGTHLAFVVSVSGFRFPVSLKLFLGLGHAVACVWALASVNAAPVIHFNQVDIATLFLFPLISIFVTVGGAVVSRLTGFHRGRMFSIADVMLLVTAVAILLPILMRIVPESQFIASVSFDSIKSALWYSLSTCGWCVVVTNIYLRYLPEAEHGKTHWQIGLGWFLFWAMLNWSHCQFGVIAATWLWVSMVPIFGMVKSRATTAFANPDTS